MKTKALKLNKTCKKSIQKYSISQSYMSFHIKSIIAPSPPKRKGRALEIL